jgi:hypothetical protein
MHPKVRGCIVGIHPLAGVSVFGRGGSRQQTIGYEICEATSHEIEQDCLGLASTEVVATRRQWNRI